MLGHSARVPRELITLFIVGQSADSLVIYTCSVSVLQSQDRRQIDSTFVFAFNCDWRPQKLEARRAVLVVRFVSFPLDEHVSKKVSPCLYFNTYVCRILLN